MLTTILEALAVVLVAAGIGVLVAVWLPAGVGLSCGLILAGVGLFAGSFLAASR